MQKAIRIMFGVVVLLLLTYAIFQFAAVQNTIARSEQELETLREISRRLAAENDAMAYRIRQAEADSAEEAVFQPLWDGSPEFDGDDE